MAKQQIVAQYGGNCAECNQRFEEDDLIVFSQDADGWVPVDHDYCWDEDG